MTIELVLAKLAAIEAGQARILTMLGTRASGHAPSSNGGGPTVAPDSDLDSPHGDESVKFTPRDWTGEPVTKGTPMSMCAPDMLDMLAEAYDFFARKNDDAKALDNKGRPKGDWDRKTAARARGWAKRLRANPQPKAAPPTRTAAGILDDYDFGGESGADDIPF